MPGEPLPSPDDAIRELIAEVAARIGHGEKPAAIRAELLREGLDPEIVDYILAQCPVRAAGHWRTRVAATLTAILFFALPAAGTVGALWLVWPAPEVFLIGCVAVPVAGALGFGVGVGLAFAAAHGLSAWSERDVPDDIADS
jgi:hypothetical protein